MQSVAITPLYSVHKLWSRIADVRRRQGWLLDNLTVAKLRNLLVAFIQFVLKQEKMRAWPVVVKIDITPLCNLRCPTCVHAEASVTSPEELKQQSFHSSQKMSLTDYKRIIDEIAGRSMAVSLYSVGDPLMHSDLDTMCKVASTAGLNCHISTNFSFKLSEQRIASIVNSGLTHLTVCVDGMTQESYERTRTGGRLDWVLSNLERLVACRQSLGRVYPKVEVQFIKFQHNVHELPEALSRFRNLGIDQFTSFWGDLHNYTDASPGSYQVLRPKNTGLLPKCFWPHFSLQIKHDGDVIPCVNYRIGPQNSRIGEKRVVGNVFETGIWKVWNSHEYRRLRRFTSKPEKVMHQRELSATFCDGCPSLFHTEIDKVMRRADTHRWEELYQITGQSHVERIPRPTSN